MTTGSESKVLDAPPFGWRSFDQWRVIVAAGLAGPEHPLSTGAHQFYQLVANPPAHPVASDNRVNAWCSYSSTSIARQERPVADTCNGQAGPNNSFKPNPLRGSA